MALASIYRLAVLAMVAIATPSPTIVGRVVDTTGHPLPYVGIRISESGRGAMSDERGHFAIRSLPSDEFTLHVMCVGYFDTTIAIQSSMQRDTVIVTLRPHRFPTPTPTSMNRITVPRIRLPEFYLSERTDPDSLGINQSQEGLPILAAITRPGWVQPVLVDPLVASGASSDTIGTRRQHSDTIPLLLSDRQVRTLSRLVLRCANDTCGVTSRSPFRAQYGLRFLDIDPWLLLLKSDVDQTWIVVQDDKPVRLGGKFVHCLSDSLEQFWSSVFQ